MIAFRYISMFSGIGGLEHPAVPPLLLCERDLACQTVLRRRYEGVDVWGDVVGLQHPPKAEVVAGGWPCQDLSSAGTLGGITAKRSGLFFQMLRIAKASGAHTLVGENVPNLLTINRGQDFRTVLDAVVGEGFRFVAWRVLNARAFGLPQERRRLFVVASKDRDRAMALHASLPGLPLQRSPGMASGFYWTGGKRSICFSPGYAPALKIGATDNKGRAPVAVLLDERVRKLSPAECLRLQGFDGLPTAGLASSTILRMAGNAVPPPMGHFVLSAVSTAVRPSGIRTAFGVIDSSGVLDDHLAWTINHQHQPLANNLIDFVDVASRDSLSPQAAAGLIVRSVRSGHTMPAELLEVLSRLASDRTAKLRPSRGNSFEAFDAMADAVAAYRMSLPGIDDFKATDEAEDDLESNGDTEESSDD